MERKNMIRGKRRGLKCFLALGVLLAAAAFGVTSASAATDGTGGVVYGGESVYWAENRDSANFSGYSPAWNTWSNYQRQLYPTSIERHVRDAGGNDKFLSDCQHSEYLWYLRSGGNGFWAIYTDGATQNVPWLPGQQDPRRSGDSRWGDYLNSQGNLWGSGRVNIICSGTFKPQERNNSSTEYKTDSQKLTLKGTYATSTTVAPVRTAEYMTYTAAQKQEWNDTHENQESDSLLSPFGIWYNANLKRINALEGKSGNDFKNSKAQIESEAKAAIAKGQEHPTVTLSDKNRKGFAKGGVINVIEAEREQKIEIGNSRDLKKTSTWVEQLINGRWVEKSGTRRDSGWVETGVKGQKPSAILTSPVGKSFWQMLHAKCNDYGMTSVGNDLGNQAINVSGSSKSASETLHTKAYSSQRDLQLGNVSSSTESFRSTSYDTFYNQTEGCLPVIDCVSDPTAEGSGSDSVNNIQDNGEKRDGTYGAQAQAVIGAENKILSSDAFTFFRDNDTHNVRVDLWYPRLNTEGTGITIDAKPTLYSRFFFDKAGTPSKDLFTVYNNKNKVLDGNDVAKGKGLLFNSEVTTLGVAAQWASDEGKPHRYNADWVSEPSVANTVYTTVDGKGGASNSQTDTSKIRVYCPMSLNTKEINKPAIDPDPSPSNPVLPLHEFNADANKSVAVDFVRAGSGLNQR